MIYLFDTNAVIRLLNGDAALMRRVRPHRRGDFGLSAIVMHELFYGAFKSRHTSRTLGFIEDLAFDILDFAREDARRAGEIRAMLAAAGTPVGPYDVLIAGQALARNLTLITHNVREFSRVPDLKMEDWEA